jgi:hypothetical protein
MSEHVLELAVTGQSTEPGRRHHAPPDDALVLTELSPSSVVDSFASAETPLELATFGAVRETCPKCQTTHLKLVLRQTCVRTAHLFCTTCESCFDAHYQDGKPALSI